MFFLFDLKRISLKLIELKLKCEFNRNEQNYLDYIEWNYTELNFILWFKWAIK